MSTVAEKVFKFILEDKHAHQEILRQIPQEKRIAVIGRKGRLYISGPEGGTFTVRLTPVGIFSEDDDSDIRNEISLSDDTLIEILVWLTEDPDDPGLSPREARSQGLIKFKGDRVLYDSEEIFHALEEYAFTKMKPIAKFAVERMKGNSGND